MLLKKMITMNLNLSPIKFKFIKLINLKIY